MLVPFFPDPYSRLWGTRQFTDWLTAGA
jgi:hypothetical protein